VPGMTIGSGGEIPPIPPVIRELGGSEGPEKVLLNEGGEDTQRSNKRVENL